MAKTLPGILAWSAIVLVERTVAGAIPEYSAAEAAKHIGQKAIVTGVVQDVVQSRAHLHLELGGTPGKPDLYVFVPSFGDTDIFPDYFQYRGATIAVSGKIERRSGYLGIDVTDPSQITSKTDGLPGHFYIGYMKQKRGDLNGAIAEYDRVIELDNKNAEAYHARASAKADKGDADGAIADYGRYIELVPNDANSYGARAGLRFRQGDFDGAIADYSRIIQIFPKHAPYNDRADVKKAKGDLAGAIADYETALRLDPSNKTYKANLQRAQTEINRKQPLTRAQPAPQPVASMAPSPRTVSKPATAEIVDIAVGLAEQGIKAGNVRVVHEDGHVETVTYACNCMQPHVSANGDVGWIQCTGFDRKGYALNEKLIIRSAKGDQKEFKPDPKAPFIGAWTFVDGDSAVVIQSRSFHGPASFIRYDLATGKVTNKKDGRDDSEPPPKWAQPLST